MKGRKITFELHLPDTEPAALHELQFLKTQIEANAKEKHVDAQIAIDATTGIVVITCTRSALYDCIGGIKSPVSAQGARKSVSIVERKASA